MSAKRCCRKISETDLQELKELEEQKSKEALELFGRKLKLEKLEKERGRARILQQWEPSGAESGFAVATDGSSFSSRSPSTAHDVDEAMSTSSRKSSSLKNEKRLVALTWKVKWRSWRSKEVFLWQQADGSRKEGGPMVSSEGAYKRRR